jgi:hypothetical protein
MWTGFWISGLGNLWNEVQGVMLAQIPHPVEDHSASGSGTVLEGAKCKMIFSQIIEGIAENCCKKGC